MSAPSGRYAPSPSGNLHLGNVRTALVAWLDARAAGGRFVLRVEDIDRQRSKAHFERAQLDQLRRLGLDWDEGPDIGGPHAPYRQSERIDVYHAAIARLPTYRCVCTRKQLAPAGAAALSELASAPHGAPDGRSIYPGTCRARGLGSDTPAAIRLAVPNLRIDVIDRCCGAWSENVADTVGDFVLARADGAIAYQLAVVVDDMDMGIDSVVRGEDLRESTARQMLLHTLLGGSSPRWAHIPLVVGRDGTKLSKRQGVPDVQDLLDAGTPPGRIVAALARSLGLVDASVEEVRPAELIEGFELARIREGLPIPWVWAPT